MIPAGAIDLGHHVYVPLPPGWTDSKSSNGLDTVSSGSSKISVQVLTRTPGENPQIVMQQYVDSFSSDYDAISVSPTVRSAVSGGEPSYQYGLYYKVFDQKGADGYGTHGGVFVFPRDDGLTAIWDTFANDSAMSMGATPFQDFLRSFLTARVTNVPKPLQAFDSFRLKQPTPPSTVDANIGFSLAPGFKAVYSGSGSARATNGTYDLTVDEFRSQAGLDAALGAAEGNLNSENASVSFGDPQAYDPFGTLTHEGIGWHGVYTDGNPVNGAIDVFVDPATSNAVVITRSWYSTTDGSEPSFAEARFMISSVRDSFWSGLA